MKWLVQNLGSRLRYAMQNPGYAASSLIREATWSDERFLSAITGVSASRIRSFLDEPMEMAEFAECLRKAAVFFHEAEIESADLYAKKILVQYAAVRAFAPEVVVETGVASGVSSSYLLLAMQKNGRGRLHSIGLDDPHFLPPGKAPGWIVPDWLKSNWQLHLGDAREILPGLLKELGSVDVFIHDSLHTYEHMLWEFRAAFPYIRAGGLLFCDDALWNSAFREFSAEAGVARARILRGVGFLQKNSEAK
jgi:predicted O-methyltransferase YrrM